MFNISCLHDADRLKAVFILLVFYIKTCCDYLLCMLVFHTFEYFVLDVLYLNPFILVLCICMFILLDVMLKCIFDDVISDYVKHFELN